jgi:uncharacterized membrane protein
MDRFIEKHRRKKQQQSPYPPETERVTWIGRTNEAGLGLFLARNAEKLGIRVYGLIRQHWLGIINFHLLLFVLGSICAPYLSHLGQEGIAKYIYGFYGFGCHQMPSRSFLVFDHPIALCARCLSFYVSVLVFGLLLGLKNLQPLGLRIALILALPVVLDVLTQTLGIRESTPLLRVTTAVLLGLSISLYVYPRLKASIESFAKA